MLVVVFLKPISSLVDFLTVYTNIIPMHYSELHAHIEGTVPVGTLLKLIIKYRKDTKTIPDYFTKYHKETLEALFFMIDQQKPQSELETFLTTRLVLSSPTYTLNDFLQRIPSKFLKCFIRLEEDLALVIKETLVQYGPEFERIELIFIPKSLENEWLTEEQIVKIFAQTWRTLTNRDRIGFILSLRRTKNDVSEEYVSKVVAEYAKYCDEGIQKIDICANEVAVPYTDLSAALKILTHAKQSLSLHIGEVSTRDMVYILNEFPTIKQFNHGIQGAFEPDIVNSLKTKDVLLTVCPLSNIYTGVLSEEKVVEAISILHTNGVRYSISSDDATIINGDVYAPYKFMLEKCPHLIP